ITCHADPAALRTALERHDFDCTQMALNAGQASITEAMKVSSVGKNSFELLALPIAHRKRMGVIAMKVFGQEQLIGTTSVDKLLTYALSLPVSLASVGMPHLEHIERNAFLATNFSPMSSRERQRLSDGIATDRKLALMKFFEAHEDC